MQNIKIIVPDGYEVQIIRKEEKKEQVIRTYQDLIDNQIIIKGYWITGSSLFEQYQCAPTEDEKNLAASEKVAKSMLAMAMISQLMPYYGGEITKEEWENEDKKKYSIVRKNNKVEFITRYSLYNFLTFHTEEQRAYFLNCNERLIKDYLMID